MSISIAVKFVWNRRYHLVRFSLAIFISSTTRANAVWKFQFPNPHCAKSGLQPIQKTLGASLYKRIARRIEVNILKIFSICKKKIIFIEWSFVLRRRNFWDQLPNSISNPIFSLYIADESKAPSKVDFQNVYETQTFYSSNSLWYFLLYLLHIKRLTRILVDWTRHFFSVGFVIAWTSQLACQVCRCVFIDFRGFSVLLFSTWLS